MTLDHWLSTHPASEVALLFVFTAAVFVTAYWAWMWACALPFG
jgi:hypothetical protein